MPVFYQENCSDEMKWKWKQKRAKYLLKAEKNGMEKIYPEYFRILGGGGFNIE